MKKFIISRASSCLNEKPCSGAFKEKDTWFIELKLDSILDFVKEHGDCVIQEPYPGDKTDGSIIIYDSYLE